MIRRTALAASLLISFTAADAGARQDAKILMTPDPNALKWQQEIGYADAVVTGDTIYLSGVVASLKEGETDLHPAYERAFQTLGDILLRAGASWDDVVEITSFHTDLTTQMPVMIEVKKRFIKEPHPAWTAIGVSRLIPARGLTEIRLIAKLPKKK